MTLTTIEYDAIMAAINNAYAEIKQDMFIDPYSENIEGYTNAALKDALESVEMKLQAIYNPF